MAVSKADGAHVDVLIVGAGISGVDAAYRLKTRCPTKSWLILEARERVGGTWDLFRFPGVRSDSDMYTLSFPFRPWRSDQAIVDGESIRRSARRVEDDDSSVPPGPFLRARRLALPRRLRDSFRVGRA